MLNQCQFLFIDLLLILPIAIFSEYPRFRLIEWLANVSLVGWTGPFPVLCQKRPTANLVSRKVLTPLLGQIAICIMIQAVAFQAVRRQPW